MSQSSVEESQSVATLSATVSELSSTVQTMQRQQGLLFDTLMANSTSSGNSVGRPSGIIVCLFGCIIVVFVVYEYNLIRAVIFI